MRLFDYETMLALNYDLSRYKDMLHFDLARSEYLIDAMRDGIGRVDRRQLAANDARLIDQINSYDRCRDRGPLAQRH